MTRVLAELLGRNDPGFILGLRQVEQSAGMPNTDIRLSVEVQQGVRRKLKELGLDPDDTTGEELYAVLGEKVKADEARFLTEVAANAEDAHDVAEKVIGAVQSQLQHTTSFSLKTAVAKKLIKANLPKKTMKLLGYRSADSMLKHETAASLTAAAWLVEADQWSKKQLVQYGKLKASDFEIKKVSVELLSAQRWEKVAEHIVRSKRHNVIGLREFGTVVCMPVSLSDGPKLPAVSLATLTVHAINDIHAASTYLKLHQVQPRFGEVVRRTVQGQTVLETKLFDQPVLWQLVQQYFSRFQHGTQARIFEPVIQAEDFIWHSAEQVLAAIEPGMDFWTGTNILAHVHAGQTVPLNLTDQLLSHCNQLPYARRISHEFRQALSTELALRYMVYDRLQQSIIGQLQHQLAFEPAIV